MRPGIQKDLSKTPHKRHRPSSEFFVKELAVGGISVVKLRQETQMAVAQSGFPHFEAGFTLMSKVPGCCFFHITSRPATGRKKAGESPRAIRPPNESSSVSNRWDPGTSEFAARVNPEKGFSKAKYFQALRSCSSIGGWDCGGEVHRPNGNFGDNTEVVPRNCATGGWPPSPKVKSVLRRSLDGVLQSN
jgi:hypothetical protein